MMNGGQVAAVVALMIVLQNALVLHAAAPTAASTSDSAGIAFFEKRIRPVLVEKCYSCHSAQAEELKAGLHLDSRAGILDGGDSGPAAVPGKPADSLIIQALHYDGYEMPPTGKLPDPVLADFEHWIEIGMPDPRKRIATAAKSGINIEEGRKFWSFQPLAKTAPRSEVLVVSADRQNGTTDGAEVGMAKLRERPIYSGEARSGGACARTGYGQGDVAAARDL
jgi:hypothetical protein